MLKDEDDIGVDKSKCIAKGLREAGSAASNMPKDHNHIILDCFVEEACEVVKVFMVSQTICCVITHVMYKDERAVPRGGVKVLEDALECLYHVIGRGVGGDRAGSD